jgi:AraC-like DNA-binding protein
MPVVWALEGETNGSRKRLFPDGSCYLLVNLGARLQVLDDPASKRLPSVCFVGPRSKPMLIVQPARQDIIGVTLTTMTARAVLGQPLREMRDLVVSANDCLGVGPDELAERCAESRSDRLQIVATWVRDRLQRSRALSCKLAFCSHEIERRGGVISIAELRATAGFSKARIATVFGNEIGLTPKKYARTVRFGRALKLLQKGAGSLASVASATGYFDQAHMAADFRRLGGLTAGEFLLRRYSTGAGEAATG